MLEVSSVYELFLETCRKFPQKKALIYLGQSYTFSQLKELSERFAQSLSNLGVREGDKAVLYLPNCPQWIISWLALQRLNAISVPISPIYTPQDLKYMINDSESETIICTDTNFGYVAQVFPETCLKRVIVTNIAHMLPLLKKVIGHLFDKIPRGKVAYGDTVFSFKKILFQGKPSSLPPFKSDKYSIFEMLYTGGTTGV
ncbi:MAG: AMP-binding protein, partial [Deltaproteobacteria bacterium]|nr:AMP-binding protein [Deltaproteobacteria bacterium]